MNKTHITTNRMNTAIPLARQAPTLPMDSALVAHHHASDADRWMIQLYVANVRKVRILVMTIHVGIVVLQKHI